VLLALLIGRWFLAGNRRQGILSATQADGQLQEVTV